MDDRIVLRAKEIQKSFAGGGRALQVLKGVDLEIHRGTLTAIIGASGVGKSTLLHILGGLDFPDSGEVRVDSTNLFSLSDKELCNFRSRTIGFVFQFHHLLSEFDSVENVMIPQLIANQNKSISALSAYQRLEEVNLKERFHHRPSQLSGGEQQRLAVARALANHPKLVIADEPTGNLDKKSSRELLELMFKLKGEKQLTFILATHNLEMAKTADFVYEIADGKAHPRAKESLN